jgi:hypothetical protein
MSSMTSLYCAASSAFDVSTAFFAAVTVVLSLATGPTVAGQRNDMNFGHFGAPIQVEWLRGDASERRMKLLRPVEYTDPSGKLWIVPAGYVTDGASIPRAFWTLVGAPYEGAYREAAVVHDFLCDSKNQPYQDVHRLFYYATRAAGVSEVHSKILYAGVLIGGPKWEGGRSKCYGACHELPTTYSIDTHGQLTLQPPATREEAQKVAAWIKAKDPDLAAIESYVELNFPHSRFGHASMTQ